MREIKPKIKFIQAKNLSKIPKSTGVYFLLNKGTRSAFIKPMYIGKASSMRNRIKTHLKKPSWLLANSGQEIKKIGYIETGSEIEALILESQMIKKYQPKLNIMLRDDKGFFYIKIGNEELPRLRLIHQPTLPKENLVKGSVFLIDRSKILNRSGGIVIGPFTDGKALKQTLKWLRKIFPYKTCKNPPSKPCFYWHLDLCPAHYKTEKERERAIKKYKGDLKILTDILQGKKKSVFSGLKREMKTAAKKQDFEQAAKLRDQIKNLKNIFQHSAYHYNTYYDSSRTKIKDQDIEKYLKIEKIPRRIEAYDISNIQGTSATGSMVVFQDFELRKSQYRRFKIKTVKQADDTAMIQEVLSRRFKHKEWLLPDLIFIDGGKTQINAAASVLRQYKLNTPFMSLAKNSDTLYICVNSFSNSCKLAILKLANLPNLLQFLILNLKDEAHRFAISYHRKLRKKKIFE